MEIRCSRLLRSVSERFDSTSFSEMVCGSISRVACDWYSFGSTAATKIAARKLAPATASTRRLRRATMRFRSSSWMPCSESMGASGSEQEGVEGVVDADRDPEGLHVPQDRDVA